MWSYERSLVPIIRIIVWTLGLGGRTCEKRVSSLVLAPGRAKHVMLLLGLRGNLLTLESPKIMVGCNFGSGIWAQLTKKLE